jgi:hypothetical protein
MAHTHAEMIRTIDGFEDEVTRGDIDFADDELREAIQATRELLITLENLRDNPPA